ncbi:MAG: hypothetical protein L6V81_02675 [Clostridium sp.]|nr:MAG: hypothetical protein L6V81_02675 [Clostridium sp.]
MIFFTRFTTSFFNLSSILFKSLTKLLYNPSSVYNIRPVFVFKLFISALYLSIRLFTIELISSLP